MERADFLKRAVAGAIAFALAFALPLLQPASALAANFAAASQAAAGKGSISSAAGGVHAFGANALHSPTRVNLANPTLKSGIISITAPDLSLNGNPVVSAESTVLMKAIAVQSVKTFRTGFGIAETEATTPREIAGREGVTAHGTLKAASKAMEQAGESHDFSGVETGRIVFDSGSKNDGSIAVSGGSGRRRGFGKRAAAFAAAILLPAQAALARPATLDPGLGGGAGPVAAPPIAAATAPAAKVAAASSPITLLTAAPLLLPILYALRPWILPDYNVESKSQEFRVTFGEALETGPALIIHGILTGLAYWTVGATMIFPAAVAGAMLLGTFAMNSILGQYRSVVTYAYQNSHDLDRLVGVGDRAQLNRGDKTNWVYGTGLNGDRGETRAPGLIGRRGRAAIRIAGILFGALFVLSSGALGVLIYSAALTLLFLLEDAVLRMRGPPKAPVPSNHIDR